MVALCHIPFHGRKWKQMAGSLLLRQDLELAPSLTLLSDWPELSYMATPRGHEGWRMCSINIFWWVMCVAKNQDPSSLEEDKNVYHVAPQRRLGFRKSTRLEAMEISVLYPFSVSSVFLVTHNMSPLCSCCNPNSGLLYDRIVFMPLFSISLLNIIVLCCSLGQTPVLSQTCMKQ